MDLYESNQKTKRFMAIINGKKYHFGLKNGRTYIDHHDKIKRQNYIKRHKVNENWDAINAGSLSRYLLWGDSISLEKNVKDYIKRFNL
jgi:hypothetical protein